MPTHKNLSRARYDSDVKPFCYTSETHRKILDYHVAEILLSTLALAIIAFFRLHH